MLQRLHAWTVRCVYARHNQAPPVRAAVAGALAELDRSGGWGLDLGSGGSRLHPRMLRLDIDPAGRPDCRGSAEQLPFADSSLRVIVSQEVFEHLPDPWTAIREVRRVLAPGGALYLQTPFIIGYHPGPSDYWRFTNEGLERLVASAGLELERLETAVGAGTGMYRIATEFCAVMAAAVWQRAYLPAKGLAAVLLSPLRWADRLPARGMVGRRIPGGYLALARKPA
ncbi:MAG: class I SAM-dependent methyltransferase [Bryobacterales bacterium]|nr:class I SAM-dependent methyltransferase [Bryobacterales bacterium]